MDFTVLKQKNQTFIVSYNNNAGSGSV